MPPMVFGSNRLLRRRGPQHRPLLVSFKVHSRNVHPSQPALILFFPDLLSCPPCSPLLDRRPSNKCQDDATAAFRVHVDQGTQWDPSYGTRPDGFDVRGSLASVHNGGDVLVELALHAAHGRQHQRYAELMATSRFCFVPRGGTWSSWSS